MQESSAKSISRVRDSILNSLLSSKNLKADSDVASLLLLVVSSRWMRSSWINQHRIAFPFLMALLKSTAGTTDPQANQKKKFYEVH